MLSAKLDINPSIFRTYDIRGIVGETLTNDIVYFIGLAIGTFIRNRHYQHICIARDSSFSSTTLSKLLSYGLMAAGCHVYDIGMTPTPLLYFASQLDTFHAGVMITGSHNPSQYNGFKIILNNQMLSPDEIQIIYKMIIDDIYTYGEGSYHLLDVQAAYFQALIQDISLDKKLHIVIDAANGVTGAWAPQLFRNLGCTVEELYCHIENYFPNHDPDPSQSENLQDLIKKVIYHRADVGIAFDDDGDRLSIVSNQGNIINADRLLMLFAERMLKKNYRSNKIIYDVKCSNHVEQFIRSIGGEPIMWKTGHSFIKSKMKETNAELAGEMSGHFIFKDRWFGFDDGLYAAARFLEILSKENENCDSIFSKIPNSISTPELKIWVADEDKLAIMDKLISEAMFNDAININNLDGIRVSFPHGWGLIRPSNTMPCLVLRFEAESEQSLAIIKSRFKKWMLGTVAESLIPF